MVNAGAAATGDDATAVALEAKLISFDGNIHWVQRDGALQVSILCAKQASNMLIELCLYLHVHSIIRLLETINQLLLIEKPGTASGRFP